MEIIGISSLSGIDGLLVEFSQEKSDKVVELLAFHVRFEF